MANFTIVADGNSRNVAGTNANDTYTVVGQNLGAPATYVANAGAGVDTIVFDDIVAGNPFFGYAFTGSNFIENDAANFDFRGGDVYVFDNGTLDVASAIVTPQRLLSFDIALSQSTVNGTSFFDFDEVVAFDGTQTSTEDDYDLVTIDGQTATAGNQSIFENGELVGRVNVGSGLDTFEFTPEASFYNTLNAGEQQDVTIDVVIDNGFNTVSETITITLIGVPTENDDRYIGTPEDDGPVNLLGGDDFATMFDGDDIAYGEDGDDKIFAGNGDTGNDILVGGDGNDTLGGGAGNDTLIGEEHDAPTSFDDGDSDDDGNNVLFGGAGDDLIFGGGYDSGTDVFARSLPSAVTDVFSSGQRSTAANQLDSLFNSSIGDGDASLFGADGDDVLIASDDGNNDVFMGMGQDFVVLSEGQARVFAGVGDMGTDIVSFGEDNDTGIRVFTGGGSDAALNNGTHADGNGEYGMGDGDDYVNSGSGDDTVFAGGGDDVVIGGDDNDVLYGGAGNDDIDGGNGDDVIFGGAGDDFISGGAGNDSFYFGIGSGDDTVDDFASGDIIDVSGRPAIQSTNDMVIQEVGGTDTLITFAGGASVLLQGFTGIDNGDFNFA